MTAPAPAADGARPLAGVLLAAIFVLATCGLVYELIAGTLSSYLLGDSVTQFSIVIGLFLTAMGLGSYLSQFIHGNLLAWFVAIEMAVGAVGGLTALLGFAAFAYTDHYIPVFLVLVGVVGTLIGLEVPLLVRILRDLRSLPVTLAQVLSADYLGALVASLAFPFMLLPYLGLVRAGLVMGVVNVVVALIVLRCFRSRVGLRARRLQQAGIGLVVMLGGAALASERCTSLMEDRLYQDEIILALDTPHQRIVVSRWREDVRLYLNGHLQFSSIDEHRYHETLVQPALHLVPHRERVLILGGGDGLAAREVARHADVNHIDLVDIDPAVTALFASRPVFRRLNHAVFDDPRLTVHHQDAMRFLEDTPSRYDVIVMDLPDPSTPGVSKLYSRAFFNLVGRRLTENGLVVTQATSPFRSREAFWCIVHTLAAARCGPDGAPFAVRPYHTVVPTFGTWGFVLAGREMPAITDVTLRVDTRYLTEALLPTLFEFPRDMAELPTPISRLDDPAVCRLYLDGYHKYLN